MAPGLSTARTEREKKVKSLLTFTSTLTKRFDSSRDTTLVDDLQSHIRGLPLQSSSTVVAKQDELDRVGTELWNLSTRLRRNDSQPNGQSKDAQIQKNRVLCLLRVFAFLLLDSAGGQATRGREQKTCIRLMKVALKAARICIDSKDFSSATKVLERAADYQEALSSETDDERSDEEELRERLRVEYFAVRTILAWRQDRMDTAEHMFSKIKLMHCEIPPSTAENFTDLMYEMGKDLLRKRNYELAVRWLERAYDVISEQELEMLSSEAGELRLSIMQSIAQAYMKLNSPDTHRKAWDMIKLLEIDYGEKLVVPLLKLELLSTEETIDSSQFYNVLLQMIRCVVLNETNFKTIMHHIHKLKDHSSSTSCKVLDDLIELRLFQAENQDWIERAVITRTWIATTSSYLDNCLESLSELFRIVQQNTKDTLSALATHAAQTLLWKKVEIAYNQEQYALAESWCRICLYPLFDKAGELNKSKIARKVIMCASARQDYAAAREVFSKMSDHGRNEPITRYLMYKAALHSGEPELAEECLNVVCRQSSKDATLLYACVLEAQNSGYKQQAIFAHQKVLQKYDYSAPAGVHLPALLRCTLRLLIAELVKDGKLIVDILDQICTVLEGACTQAKVSRRRPSTPAQQLFTPLEFEWFCKNAYNLSLKYCAEVHPGNLIRLLSTCIDFIKLLQEQDRSEDQADLPLRLSFCNFLAACTFTTLARAEDNTQICLQHYLEARKHCQEFRRIASEELKTDKHGESAKADIIWKHFQIVKLELEAVLKLEQWDILDEVFEQCWKYKSPDHYETLADLVLISHSCIIKANLDGKYQSKILTVLQRIINDSYRSSGNDIVKLSRWIRCLFQLALTFDETISMKCIEKAWQMASKRYGTVPPGFPASALNTPPPSSSPLKQLDIDVEANTTDMDEQNSDRYPPVELEWLATTAFNFAVDYYVQENDDKAKIWAEKALSLTEWAEDGGGLKKSLMDKYSALVWSKE